MSNLNTLTQEQFVALTAAQIKSIPPADFSALDINHCMWLTYAQTNALSAAQVAAMSPQQLGALPHPEGLFAGAAGLSVEDVAVINPKLWLAENLNNMQAAVVAAVPPAGIAALALNVRFLSAKTISAMTLQQIAAIPKADLLPPTAVSALTAPQIASLTVNWSIVSSAWFNALSGAAVAAIPATSIAQLSGAVLQGLQASTVSAMSPQQLNAIAQPTLLSIDATQARNAVLASTFDWGTATAAMINAMSPQAIAAIPVDSIKKIPPAVILALNATALASVTAAQVSALQIDWTTVSASVLNALSPTTIAAVSPDKIAQLSVATVQALAPSFVTAMTVDQFKAFTNVTALSSAAANAISAAQAAVISSTQINALQINWATVGASVLNALAPTTIAAVSPDKIAQLSVATVQALAPSFVTAMTVAQFKTFTNLTSLSGAAVNAISAAQAAVISSTQINALQIDWTKVSASVLSALSATTIAAISPDKFAKLSVAAAQALAPSFVTAMTVDQFKAFTNVTALSGAAANAISAAQAAVISSTQINALQIDWSKVGASVLNALAPTTIAAVSPDKIAQLSVATVQALAPSFVTAMTVNQFKTFINLTSLSGAAANAISAAQAAGISSTQINALQIDWSKASATLLNALSPTTIAAISSDKIAQLSVATVQGLTSAFVTAMTVDQFKTFTNVAALSSAAASAISAAQAAVIANNQIIDWTTVSASALNALSPTAIAAIAPDKIAGLSTAIVKALTPSFVTAMTVDQFKAFTNVTSLSSAAANAISAAQATAITGNLYWVNPDWVNALSPQALAAIPPKVTGGIGHTSMAGLIAATVANFTPDQLNNLSYIRFLTPAALGGLTAAQTAKIANGQWYQMGWGKIAYLSDAAMAAVTTSAIDYISYYDISVFNAARIPAMTPAQIGALYKIEKLSLDAVAVLSPDQIKAISQSAWGKVSSDWFNALSPTAVSGIGQDVLSSLSRSVVGGFSLQFVQSMNAEQLSTLNPVFLSNTVLGSLPLDKLSLIKNWDSVSASFLNSLSLEAFAAISADGINQMSLVALQGLDANRRRIAIKKADVTHAGYIAMASKDASINYDSALTQLQCMKSEIGAGGLSADQFTSFNQLLNGAKAANGEQTYVSSLMTSMLKEGVQMNMSADAFGASVNEWFLGSVNATTNSTGSINVADMELFRGSLQQAADGVSQGGLGDCGIIASLEEFAELYPERLSGLIGANGNGTYGVKLYNKGTPFFVTVDSTVQDVGASVSAGSWARLMEDALAKSAAESGVYWMWSSLNGNYSFTTQMAIGGGSNYQNWNSAASGYSAIVSALADGEHLVTYSSFKNSTTGPDGMTNLVGSHAFAVTGIDKSNGNFIFRNPWDDYYTFEISAETIDTTPGSGYFSVTKLSKEYDPQLLAQAMASFDAPSAVNTAANQLVATQSIAQPTLTTPLAA
ncbi:C2 family cysteine protease [Neisseriaceae bacterium JH1-16]|nr:C2 family cysteine protease [Neisseriaceae bacterium JH1-16]